MFKPRLAEKVKSVHGAALKVGTAIVLISGMQTVDAANDMQEALSATLQHRFKPTQYIVSQSRVVVNAEGYRLDGLPLAKGQVIIANLLAGKTWFVDTSRAYIHEVPFNDVVGAPELDEVFISLPGSIDSIPCSQAGGMRIGDVQFKGRLLEQWQCNVNSIDDADNAVMPVQQYFSRKHDIVVYSRSTNDVVTELLDITRTRVNNNVFKAPKGLHTVTIEQFMGLHLPLERYQEPVGNQSD
ncbi:MAG: hypothetical protein AB8B64_16700 [Granulosicoccus sp.]